MKLLTPLLLLLSITAFGQQDQTIQFPSKFLDEKREINIHIPQSYEEGEDNYPVIYALDGEYTKLILNGTVDYYNFWDKTPECIVVSINQNYADSAKNNFKRWDDCSYSWKTGLINEKGQKFKDFITQELIPYIDAEYRTTKFRTIVGHSFTANFVNYFLFDKTPKFSAYISISPYYATNGLDSLEKRLNELKAPVFYYVAAGDKDLSGHIKSVDNFDQKFKKVDNSNFNYKKYETKKNNATHATIFPLAIPHAIEHIFSLYSPIDDQEFEKLLDVENKVEYLNQRYANIENIYGLQMPIREGDITAVADALGHQKQWDQFKEISEEIILLFPESTYGYYYLGDYYNEKKEYRLALEQYEIGYSKLSEDVLNVDDFKEPIDKMKKKLKQ